MIQIYRERKDTPEKSSFATSNIAQTYVMHRADEWAIALYGLLLQPISKAQWGSNRAETESSAHGNRSKAFFWPQWALD